jgi:YYY domain-containing protein
MALAFNLLLEATGKGLRVFGHGWRLPVTLVFTALVLGGLFVMNGWDYPTYMGITLFCITLQQCLAHTGRFSSKLLLDILLPAGLLVALSLVLYLPFFLHFVSPSQGIGLVTPNQRSLLNEELLIYGLFSFVFLSLLLASVATRPLLTRSVQTESPTERDTKLPTDATLADDSQKGGRQKLFAPSFIVLALCVVYLIASIVALRVIANSTTFVTSSSLALLGLGLVFYHLHNRAHVFALLLGTVAFGLVAACEIVYLRDVFANTDYVRMNTVFKFYFQAWVLLSVACGVGVFFIVESFRPKSTTSFVLRWLQCGVFALWSFFFLILVLASMVYPLNAPYARYAHVDTTSQTLHLTQAPNLDGLAYLASCKPPYCDYDTSGDYKAILWLNANVQGDPGIVEALGNDYSSYGRISTFTGLSSPMGWIGHEYQWRVIWITQSPANNAEYQRRASDVETIYTSTDAGTILSIMAHDHVQYLYVGELERKNYPHVDLQRYSSFMQVVYSRDGVTIYKVSGNERHLVVQ